MNTFSISASLLTHSLAWALLYSLWQGLIIFSALFILLKALPTINARAKHYLSFGAFTALFLWFADTWAAEFQKLKGIAVYITQPGTGNAAGTTYIARTISTGHLQSPMLHRLLPHIEHYFPFIILIYSAGLSFMLFRFIVNVMQVRALRTQGIMQPEKRWNDFILQWQMQFDITRPVKIFLSDRVSIPMMLGTIKPVILLPIATMSYLSTEQVEAILLHELAHIRRHDYLLNIFQTIAEAILFFNPFVWLISGIIRREREHCCDDLVVGSYGDPLPYAKALAILENNRVHESRLALAATGHKNQLFNRIKRIMEMKKNNMNNSQLTIIIVAIVVVTITATMFTFTPSFAQKTKKTTRTDTTKTTTTTTTNKKTAYKYKTVTIDSNGKKTVVERASASPIEDKDNNGDTDIDADVSVNGGKASSHTSSSYSYSYSDFDGDDLKKMIKEIMVSAKNAVSSVNWKEIEKQVAKEMENAQNEMEKIDWEAIRKEVDKGIDEVDREMKNANLNRKMSIEARRELADTKRRLAEVKREIANTRRRIYVTAHAGHGSNANVTVVTDEDEMEPLEPMEPMAPMPPMPPMPPLSLSGSNRVVIRSGGNDIESMLNKMEKEGLINRSGKFTVEKEHDKLYINGDKQSGEVYERYSKYLKHKSIDIKGRKGSLSIAINN